MSAGNYLLYRSKYWLRRQWYRIPWEWRDLVPFILLYFAIVGLMFGGAFLLRKYYGVTLYNSPVFRMFSIAIFSSCSLMYIPDLFNKNKNVIEKTLALALTIVFVLWTATAIQEYQIKFLMGL